MDKRNDALWAEMDSLGMLKPARVDAATRPRSTFVATVALDSAVAGAAAAAAAEAVGECLLSGFELGQMTEAAAEAVGERLLSEFEQGQTNA